MGTAKRARQKANRAARQVQEAQAVRTETAKRNVVKWGAALVAALAAVLLIAWIGGAFSGDDDATGDLVVTTEPVVSVAPVTDPADTTATSAATTVPAAECPAADGSSERVSSFDAYPPMCIDTSKTYTAEIVTNKGALTVELDADQAPLTVNSFVTLARYHFYDGLSCHRIITGFMAQCGDPDGTGSGGPGYTIPDEFPAEAAYVKGVVAMAKTAAPNSGGSQFFVMTADYPLPPEYTIFGQVTEGLDTTVDALNAAGSAQGVPPAEEVTIESVTITES